MLGIKQFSQHFFFIGAMAAVETQSQTTLHEDTQIACLMGGSREERKQARKEEKRQERRAEKEKRRERKRSEKEQHEKEKADKKKEKKHAKKENNKMEIECVEEIEFVENSQDDKPVPPMVPSFEGIPDPCADTQRDMHETSDTDENAEGAENHQRLQMTWGSHPTDRGNLGDRMHSKNHRETGNPV